jgi:hypothetical protein
MYIDYNVKLETIKFYSNHVVYVFSINSYVFFKKHPMMAYMDRNML